MMKINFTKISKKAYVLIITAILFVVVTVALTLIFSRQHSSSQKDSDRTSHSTALNEMDTKTQNQTNTNGETNTDNETEMTTDDKTNADDESNTDKEINVQETTANQGETVTAQEDTLEVKVEKILNNMTLEEKVYQMFIITPEALTNGNNVTTCSDFFREQLEQYPVGGIIYFAKNLVNREQTAQMLQNARQYAYEVEGMPLFLCVDEEGGRVARIANNPNFGVPNVGAMQYIGSAAKAYEAGQT